MMKEFDGTQRKDLDEIILNFMNIQYLQNVKLDPDENLKKMKLIDLLV
jgi:hypothetical protein